MSTFVMVIDDSPTIRKILEISLRHAGYEVKSFPDGVEALGWVGRPAARIPALILVDVGLPKLDGYDVIRHLKAKPALAETIFFMISRRDGVLDHLKGRLVGARAYLTKPFKIQELLVVVQAQLGTPVVEPGSASRAEHTDEHGDGREQPVLASSAVERAVGAQRSARGWS